MFIPTAFAYNIALAPAVPTIPAIQIQLPAPAPKPLPQAPQTLLDKVNALAKEYHQDSVLAYNIIKCEGLRYKTLGDNQNLDKNGNVWSTDVGPWQINDYYHKAEMSKLGLNIYNVDDNLRYGFILLSTQGTKPWLASRYCWNK